MLKQYVSHDDVVRAIKKHKGKNDTVVRKIVGLHLETLKFHSFLIDLTNVLRHANNTYLTNTVVDPEVPTLAPMAVNVYVYPTVDEWMLKNFSLLREHAYPPIKEQLAMQYDDNQNGTFTFIEMNNAMRLQYPKE